MQARLTAATHWNDEEEEERRDPVTKNNDSKLKSLSSALRTGWSRRSSLRRRRSPEQAGVASLLPQIVTHGLADPGRADRRVRINVSGMKFDTRERVLLRYPQTLLGDTVRRQRYYVPEEEEYFFDRHRPSFEGIFRYYQTGKIKRPSNVPLDVFAAELAYFDMGNLVIDTFLTEEGYDVSKDTLPEKEPQRTVWLLFESQESILSKLVGLVTVCFILLSVGTSCTETLPHFRNLTDQSFAHTGDVKTNLNIAFHNTFFQIETACIAWFCIELALRFYASPLKTRFVKDIMNILDFVVIVPYFVSLFLIMANVDVTGSNIIPGTIVRLLRLVRVFRIFKLSRHMRSLQMLGATLRASAPQLIMLVFFMAILVILYASIIYFMEMDHPDHFFPSIPEAFWWAIITLTTVGYGDIYPQTPLGKAFACICVISGILVIAMPLPIVTKNFEKFYKKNGNNPFKNLPLDNHRGSERDHNDVSEHRKRTYAVRLTDINTGEYDSFLNDDDDDESSSGFRSS
ncbi:PREDICTED: potassium voltage-gated channel subfamily A member 7-like [Branchiostoma belcheri]|uniref:Potassium voltage-gated channel subfamily A member 7-like n=1 Tax=Branchiostoma belcheri TaxID=7741 RepID=A0A6P4YF08_BRABE|nr:PREDICTED: potassium voltage-gated channel subfamily A member 7-like [Branchiostoma belcheri]